MMKSGKGKGLSIEVEKTKVFDPRDGKTKISNNPALIYAHMVKRGIVKTKLELDHFWQKIGRMADFCDEDVDAN